MPLRGGEAFIHAERKEVGCALSGKGGVPTCSRASGGGTHISAVETEGTAAPPVTPPTRDHYGLLNTHDLGEQAGGVPLVSAGREQSAPCQPSKQVQREDGRHAPRDEQRFGQVL